MGVGHGREIAELFRKLHHHRQRVVLRGCGERHLRELSCGGLDQARVAIAECRAVEGLTRLQISLAVFIEDEDALATRDDQRSLHVRLPHVRKAQDKAFV